MISPLSDPESFCGLYQEAMTAHYKNLLYEQLLMVLVGGILVGALLGYTVSAYYFNYKKPGGDTK